MTGKPGNCFSRIGSCQFVKNPKAWAAPPRHHRPCAGDLDQVKRRAFPTGMAGTRPAMTSRSPSRHRVEADVLHRRLMALVQALARIDAAEAVGEERAEIDLLLAHETLF